MMNPGGPGGQQIFLRIAGRHPPALLPARTAQITPRGPRRHRAHHLLWYSLIKPVNNVPDGVWATDPYTPSCPGTSPEFGGAGSPKCARFERGFE